MMDLEYTLAEAIFKAEPSAKYASARSEILMRCPYCGDSLDHKKAHFYVKIKLAHNEPPWFYCQKCNIKGIANSEFLRNIKIFDLELSGALTRYNKTSVKYVGNKNTYLEKASLFNPLASNIEQTHSKLKYISERIGVNLTLSDLLKLKICLNLFDLVDFNKIDKLSVSDKMGRGLDRDFLGFISVDNKYLTMRNIGNWFDGRYYKYNIFNSFDNTKSFYSIPNNVDMMSPEPVEINIAEGTFDIISVFYNLKNCDLKNNLYVANCGSGFLNTIRYFIKFGFIDCKINIYSDNDKDINFYRYIKRGLSDILVDDITVHYNNYPKEKDFGVPAGKIKAIKTTI